ncbi:MAG: sugar phosphate isomerase [Candidatus Nephthysia bennettiae]|uniref:Sugar phosphate isomerase/epimerase n=1 Tax=Candidatus Nephthysia bennettiae TaxID=3127016 RepID=A0A934K241_9BACT|nr:sugar phosphate isomerase/epimerase [Candidatus Dormibacteraeota bacterium]MBJ7614628.1 sugar phosphate isomerase/epimerase [Candidatus Dormibacteraeota bacterium]PZR92452.1 MAG: sugar phosphate isomerase [Candidatus Dormibacteraeota bacterium]
MKLGAYTACLQDRTLGEALEVLRGMGLESIEVNSGGFIPAPHIHVDALMASDRARGEYLAQMADAGLELTALNVNGNPLHPDVEVGSKHARDLLTTIELAGLLGVRNVVTMSGQPGSHPGCAAPNWVVEPWHSAATEVLEYQWDGVAVPFWRDAEQRAREAGVRVCIEMHPHNLVFNPATLLRLIERVDSTQIGGEMDPSHLFWQGIEPIVAIEHLGDRVFHAAAKDVRINKESCRLNGVLDDCFRTPKAGEPALGIGGRYVANNFPEDPPWEFVAVGRGHDVEYWTRFLTALLKVNPEIAVNIEHEDVELGQVEGLSLAADNLKAAAGAIPSSHR